MRSLSDISEIQSQWSQYDPSINTEPMALIGRMLRCAQHFNTEIESVLVKYDLNRPSFDVLATLLRIGEPNELTPNELIAQMLVSSGTMTNRINRLVTKGLVVRVKDKFDGRSVKVKITKVGKKLTQDVLNEHIAKQESLVRALNQSELKTLNKLMNKLV